VEEDPQAEVIGTLTLVYDHHAGDLSSRLTELQHRFHQAVVSTLHVHFDERNCLEVLVVRGRNAEVRQISDALIGTRGVHHGRLIIGSGVGATGQRHHHPHEKA
jgi:CopG family nickel-responsive transcriptional regulator